MEPRVLDAAFKDDVAFFRAWEGDPNAAGEDGLSLLHHCAQSNSAQVLSVLLEHFADTADVNAGVESGIYRGYTPLMFAAANSSVEAVDVLLERAGDRLAMNARDGEGHTVLHHAATRGHVPILIKLIERGADVTLKDYNWHLPLCLAANGGRTGAVHVLCLHVLKQPNARELLNNEDRMLDTPWHHCSKIQAQRLFEFEFEFEEENLQTAYTLFLSGADPSAKNKDGDTPLDVMVEPLADVLEAMEPYRALFVEFPSFPDVLKMDVDALKAKVGLPEDGATRINVGLHHLRHFLTMQREGNKNISACPVMKSRRQTGKILPFRKFSKVKEAREEEEEEKTTPEADIPRDTSRGEEKEAQVVDKSRSRLLWFVLLPTLFVLAGILYANFRRH